MAKNTRRRIDSKNTNASRIGRPPLPPGQVRVNLSRSVAPDAAAALAKTAEALGLTESRALELAIRLLGKSTSGPVWKARLADNDGDARRAAASLLMR